MARQIIAVGSAGNDGTGDTLRSGAIKMNSNFAELYQEVAGLGLLVSDSAGGLNLEGISFDQRSVVFIGVDSPNSTPADNNETYLRATEPTKDNVIILPDSSGIVALLSDIAINPNILDSAAIIAFTSSLDSAKTIDLIEQNSIDSVGVVNLIDTTYINNRVDPGLDSTLTRQEIDAYVTKSYLTSNNLTLDSGLTIQLIDSNLNNRTIGTLDSAAWNQMAQAVQVPLVPDSNNIRDLGSSALRWKDLYLSGNTIFIGDSATIQKGAGFNDNGGLRLNLAMYLDADLPGDGKAGDLLIIIDGDSATGGPVLAFKDSDNGFYVKFNSAAAQGGGGGF